MMKRVICTAVAAAALALPAAAMAADSTDMSMMANYFCRPVHSGETATVTSTDGAKLICNKVSPAQMKAMMAGPKMAPGMTAKQMDEAFQKYLEKALRVPNPEYGT